MYALHGEWWYWEEGALGSQSSSHRQPQATPARVRAGQVLTNQAFEAPPIQIGG